MKKALFCFAIILPCIAVAQVTEEWVARYDGPANDYDIATSLAVDGAGNVYITGCSDFYTDPFVGDYATIKYNSSGVEQWVARYDGSASNWDVAFAIAVDDAGNVYVTGGGGGEYATVKYNSSGVEQWVARYDGLGNGNDKAQDIALDDSGNVYVTGYSKGSGIEDYDYATVKYNSAGTELWVARYDGPASGWDRTCAIAIDDSGNVYVTGWSYGSGTLEDYATVKYSQGPGVAEASPDVSGHRLEVAQLTPKPAITYTLPSSSSISLKLYDVTGKLVKTLVSGTQTAGQHSIVWDAEVPSGVYFVRLETSNRSATGKLVVAR